MAVGITNAQIGSIANPYVATTDSQMANYLADTAKKGSFVLFSGSSASDSYVSGQIYRILDSGDIEQYVPIGSLSQVVTVEIVAPAAAVNGTITADQLAILQASDNNNIMFNHEKFYLMDKGHTEGFLTYSHTGIENDLIYIKTFTITINTLTWVLNIRSVPEMSYDADTKTLTITE